MTVRRFIALLFVVACVQLTARPVLARDIAMDASGAFLYTANHDSASVSKMTLASLEKQAEFAFGMPPDNLAIDDEGRIWVTSRLRDLVVVLDPSTGIELARIGTGDQPFDLAHLGNGRTAVSLFGADEVVLIDRTTFAVVSSVATPSAPRGLGLSPDGQKLLVTHFRQGSLSIIDIAGWTVDKTIQPEADGNLSQNVAVSADGTRAYLPLTRANVSNRALLFDNTVFPVVSVVDPVNAVAVPSERISIDIADEPVGIPLDAALAGDYLFVLNAASNDLTVVDLGTRQGAAHLEVGDNPRSMVLSPDNTRLYIHNSLSGTVSVVDTEGLAVLSEVSVSTNALPAQLLNGKRLFNSSDRTDIARDQWIACATCHFDGEMDARTWFFPDGPRNTPSLLGSGATAPYHWSGDLDELQDVETTIRTLQAGTGLAEGGDNCTPACDAGEPNSGRSADLDDLAAYIASLPLPPSPRLMRGGALTPAAIRGAALFESDATGCADCHRPPLFTDRQRHDVGTGGHPDERKGPDFDTPSLRGVLATAPYLHDGRATTLREVLVEHNPVDRHGVTTHLTEQELDDLIAFIVSLPFEIEIFRDGFE